MSRGVGGDAIGFGLGEDFFGLSEGDLAVSPGDLDERDQREDPGGFGIKAEVHGLVGDFLAGGEGLGDALSLLLLDGLELLFAAELFLFFEVLPLEVLLFFVALFLVLFHRVALGRDLSSDSYSLWDASKNSHGRQRYKRQPGRSGRSLLAQALSFTAKLLGLLQQALALALKIGEVERGGIKFVVYFLGSGMGLDGDRFGFRLRGGGGLALRWGGVIKAVVLLRFIKAVAHIGIAHGGGLLVAATGRRGVRGVKASDGAASAMVFEEPIEGAEAAILLLKEG